METDGGRERDATFKGGFAPPARTGMLGMGLFLAALGMLFASGMLGYVLVRTRPSLAGMALRLPQGLWASTGLILLSSWTIHQAVRSVRLERQRALRVWLAASLALAVGFVAVQAPCLWALLAEHAAQRQHGLAIYGLIFFLVLLHALHVLGGIIALTLVNVRASAHGYDHERLGPVRYTAVYWHFLDAVWIVMFAVLQLVG